MNDERLRALYARVLERPLRAVSLARVSVERMLALVERRGDEVERLRTLDLVMRDRDRILELDVLIAAVGTTSRWSRLRPTMMAAAAVLLIAIGLGPVARHWSGATDQLRGGTVQQVRLIGPAERVGLTPITFSWAAVGGARDYEIEVLDADGLSAFVTTVRGTSIRLPADIRLRPGQEYRWWVVARRADGTRIGAIPRRLRLDAGTDRGPASSAQSPFEIRRSIVVGGASVVVLS